MPKVKVTYFIGHIYSIQRSLISAFEPSLWSSEQPQFGATPDLSWYLGQGCWGAPEGHPSEHSKIMQTPHGKAPGIKPRTSCCKATVLTDLEQSNQLITHPLSQVITILVPKTVPSGKWITPFCTSPGEPQLFSDKKEKTLWGLNYFFINLYTLLWPNFSTDWPSDTISHLYKWAFICWQILLEVFERKKRKCSFLLSHLSVKGLQTPELQVMTEDPPADA